MTATWRLETSDQAGGAHGQFRPTVLMEKVSAYLVLAGDEVSRKDVEANVRGKAAYVRQAMDALVAEGFATERDGPHGARLLRTVRRPFTTSSQLVPTSSHDPEDLPRPSSRPLQGDEDEDEVERLAEVARGYEDFEPAAIDEATL